LCQFSLLVIDGEPTCFLLRHAGYNYARLMFFAPPLSAGGWRLIQYF
jgi:hypothetical protein